MEAEVDGTKDTGRIRMGINQLHFQVPSPPTTQRKDSVDSLGVRPLLTLNTCNTWLVVYVEKEGERGKERWEK